VGRGRACCDCLTGQLVNRGEHEVVRHAPTLVTPPCPFRRTSAGSIARSMCRLCRLPVVLRVLFLCVHNSARSQMAEGMLRAWAGDRYDAQSAGSAATEVRPLAIRAMEEIGIDISGQRSKTVQTFDGQHFDFAVAVCNDAKEACPYFPADKHFNWSFDDPAAASGSEEDRLAVFRRVRDEIAERVRATFVNAPRT